MIIFLPAKVIKLSYLIYLFIYLFGVLRRFQHCTGHITTGSWKGRGNQYIEFARVVYCKLPTNGKQLPAFPLTAMTGIDPRPQRWEARVLPLCHRGPQVKLSKFDLITISDIKNVPSTKYLKNFVTSMLQHSKRMQVGSFYEWECNSAKIIQNLRLSE